MSLRRSHETRGYSDGPHRPAACLDFVHVDQILVRRSAFVSARSGDLSRSNAEVVGRLLTGAVEPHEIHVDAMRAYMAEFYAAEVHAGGHARFALAMQGQRIMIEFLRDGLGAMGARAHLSLLERFLRSAQEPLDLAELDRCFNRLEAEASLADLCGDWLRNRPALHVTEDARLDCEISDRLQRLPRARSCPPAPRRRRHSAEDPHSRLAERLCGLAAREWLGWTGRVPIRFDDRPGPGAEGLAWSAATSEGPCLFYLQQGRACLSDQATGRVLATLPLQG